jgi:hypothetical protein
MRNGRPETISRKEFSRYASGPGISRQNTAVPHGEGREGVRATFHTKMGNRSSPQLSA